MEFGTAQATHNHGALRHHQPRRHRRPAAQPIPQPDRAVDNTTIWAPELQTRATTRTCCSRRRSPASARCGTSTSRTRPAPTPSTARSRTGCSCRSTRRPTARTTAAASSASRDIQRLLEDGLNGWYAKQIAAGKTDAADQRRTCRSSTSGTGTTTTATATSTSRTATSTTSRRSTPARARRPAAAPRAPTPSGAIGRPRTWPGSAPSAPTATSSAACGSAARTYWVFDYTVEPENGGVGVFSHEFGHDLGIPDEYDTSGNTGGAENSTGFWTPWSSGSYGSDGTPANGIGNRPFSMSAWDKLVFGWLDYQLVKPGDGKTKITLGPSEAQSTAGKQAAVVTLPDKQVAKNVGAPFAGREVLLLGHRQRHGQRHVQVGHAPGRGGDPDREGPLQHRRRAGTTPT